MFAAAQTTRITEPIKPHLTWNLAWQRIYWRHPQPRELILWWKRNYRFFGIKRIHQWHAECYLSLLKVKRRTYSTPCTDCSFIKHYIIWLFIMIVLKGEFAEGRVSNFSSAFWRIVPANKTFLNPSPMQRKGTNFLH